VGDGERTIEHVKKLAALRAQEPALSRGGWTEAWRQRETTSNVLGFRRSEGASRVVVVLSNVAGEANFRTFR
jgi:hypothetical protein